MKPVWVILFALAVAVLAFLSGRWTAPTSPVAYTDTVFVASPPVTVTVEKIVPKVVKILEHDTVSAPIECPYYHSQVAAVSVDTVVNGSSLFVGYTLPTPLQPLGLFDRIAFEAHPETVAVPMPVYVKEGVGFWTVAAVSVGMVGVGMAVGANLAK